MQLTIPGIGFVELRHLVLDFNGTIARDGLMLSNLDRTLAQLSQQFEIHILTADTGGTVQQEMEGVACSIKIISESHEAEQKEAYVRQLGVEQVVCMGNGANDRLMLQAARLGIAVLEGEGTAFAAISSADIVVRSIYDAMGLLMVPQRIVATLRS